MKKYTVLQTVYKNDDPIYLKDSINSMLNQSIKPDEYLLLVDGPISNELKLVIDSIANSNKEIFKVKYFKANRGLGPVLADGVILSSNEYIARMDSDDIAKYDRCEKQIKVLNNETDLVGGNISEFINDVDNTISKRLLPENHDEIVKFSKERNPFNHPSVMFKKSKVLEAGNYRQYHLCEDYDLWTRMIMNNSKCYNVQDIILFMRTSKDFYKRRSGMKYLQEILKFKKELLNKKYISKYTYLKLFIKHSILCLSPNSLRSMVYKKMLRK